MKVDMLTLKQHLEADGIFTDEQATRLVYLLCKLGLVEPGGQGAPSFPSPIRSPSTPGAELAHLEGLWWDVDQEPGSGPGYSSFMLVPGGFVVLTSRTASDGGALAQSFVPCGRDAAVRVIRQRSTRFARAVEGTREVA
jgi:hypothetical protein